MQATTPITKPTPIDKPKEEKVQKETKVELDYEAKKYILRLILTESNLLILELKEKNTISLNYHLMKKNLEDLKQIDKQFRLYDSMSEVFEALNDILNMNQVSLQKLNDNLVINFIFPLPGNKKKEIVMPFRTRNEAQININEQLIKKVNDLEDKLNKEIEENKMYKTIINENKNVINELKEEIKILKSEITDLQKWKKEKEEKKEKEKESNIIKDKGEYEFIENRLKLAGNNREIRYKLLYRASRDGDKSKIFHEKCNGISGTLSLVKTTDNIKFGGYTEALWDGSGFKKDEKAFCFSLDLKKIYNIAIPDKAIQSEEHLGPRFANSLFGIYDKSFKDGGWCSYVSDKQYGTIEKEYEITGGKNEFGVKEVEVFQIIFK